MERIKIAITGRVASVAELPEVVADNAEYEVDFALDPREGWDMSLPITALFVRRDGSYTARILDAGETSCIMPPQTGTNIVFVGLTQDDMRTTTPATIKVRRSIRTVANDPLPAPSEDVYAQILAAYAGVKILSGKGAPTSETQGKVNQLYRDEDTQRLYICTATDGGYTWAEVSGGTGCASEWNSVSGKPFETVGEGLAVDSGKKLRVSEAVMQEIAGKVDSSTLQNAVDNALEEAKASGTFDGSDGKSAYEIAVENGFTGTAEEWIASLQGEDGVSPHIGGNGNWYIGTEDTGVKAHGEKGETGATGATGADGHTPVKGTDYFTNADKQEIAESAAGMVDVPDKLPNPNALTFTGAVNGSYDGSAPLNVEIPSGGGGGYIDKNLRLIATVAVTSGTTSYSVTADSDGNAFRLKDVYIWISSYFGPSGSYTQIKLNNKELTRAYGASGSQQVIELEKMGDLQKLTVCAKPSDVIKHFGNYYNGQSAVSSLAFWSSSVTKDATIEIYGVDA